MFVPWIQQKLPAACTPANGELTANRAAGSTDFNLEPFTIKARAVEEAFIMIYLKKQSVVLVKKC